jgi:phosphate transport system substrate-binding protein
MQAQVPQTNFVVLCGSDSMGAILIPRLAEASRKEIPGVRFDIRGEGTGAAFSSLAERNCRLGMASRPIQRSEAALLKNAGVEVEVVEVARDQMVIYVNAANPVQGLSTVQVEKIFTGEVTNWTEVGGPHGNIVIYGRNPEMEGSKVFRQLAMGGREFARTMQQGGADSPLTLVSRDPNGITFGNLQVRSKLLKALPIDKAVPGTIQSNPPYPWNRPFLLYVSKDATAMERSLLKFIRSPKALEVIQSIGLLPPSS